MRVALLGLGTVGRPTAGRLIDATWRADVDARGMIPPDLVAVGVQEPDRPRGIDLPETVGRTDDLDALVVDPSVDVVVELMGGVERAGELLERALAAGKHVVTANKALLARRGQALETAARAAAVGLRFEAAVAGGIPLLAPLVRDLAADRIDAIRGIVNGTTNFILSAMAREGQTLEDALETARARGYAEADASADIDGLDAADKVAILARLAFGGWPDVDRIRRGPPTTEGDGAPGIGAVRTTELRAAAGLGMTIKLVGEVRPAGRYGEVPASVMPVVVSETSPIGSTDGITNLVEDHRPPARHGLVPGSRRRRRRDEQRCPRRSARAEPRRRLDVGSFARLL